MLSKCANPVCSTEFIYLREGKLFVMEQPTRPVLRQEGPVASKTANRLEHFWLCGPCSEDFTLEYSSDRGVRVVAKKTTRMHAVAS